MGLEIFDTGGLEIFGNRWVSPTIVTPVLASFYQTAGAGLISVPASAGADTVCLLGATQELDAKTLDSSVGKGTWTASGTWTLPAVTFGGTISIGAQLIKTTNLALKELSATEWTMRNAADNADTYLTCAGFRMGVDLRGSASGASITALDTNAATLLFKARDTDVALAEIGRLVGAADPYFQIHPLVPKPTATASLPATPVEGMVVYDDTANKLKVWNGAAWETVTSAT